MTSFFSVLRSARSFFAGTAFSRVSGLLRDMAMAVSFGSSPEIAAFTVAYRLSNLFRRILGEGNLQAGFVPQFVAQKEKGAFFYRDVAVSMAILLLAVIGVLEAILWGCLSFVGPDWREIVQLTMWMVPGLFFICLYGLNSALLQCHKKYFLPAVAPVVFNLIWIGAVLLVPEVKFLALAVTAAFAGQWLLTVWEGARLLSWRQWCNVQIFSADFKALLRPLFLGIVGVSAVQLNSALDAIFARLADPEGPAFLWYAIRIEQLPLALFGLSLSGALLPPLAKAAGGAERLALLRSALRVSGMAMLFCTLAILSLGRSGVDLLYGHGTFTDRAVQSTSACLWGYGLGLVPSVFILLLAAKHYADKNYRTPMIASLVSVGINMGLNALFIFGLGWGAVSVAIATSLSALVNMALLARGVFTWDLGLFFLKVALACLIPALGALWLDPGSSGGDLVQQCVTFFSLSFFYIGGSFLIAWRFKLYQNGIALIEES